MKRTLPANGASLDQPARSSLIAKIAELGEYFVLPGVDSGEWQGFPLILDHTTVMDFVLRTQRAIANSMNCDPGSIPIRLASSSFQLGIAARLLSPIIGAAVCCGWAPILSSESVKWRSTSGHSPQFATTELEWVEVRTMAHAATLISESVLSTILHPLNAALRSLTSLSARVTWGNVMSASNGAVTVLAMSRPEREGIGRALVRALMDCEQLAETGSFVRGSFVRHSCCLFYQAPGAGFCGDCVLAVSDRSH